MHRRQLLFSPSSRLCGWGLSFRGVCQRSCRLPSLPLKPSSSTVTASEALAELTQATLEQPVDDEAVYYNVTDECPKGRVYGLGSLGRNNIRYADSGASTSQLSKIVPRSEFDSVVEQLRQVVAFMQRQFDMTMDEAGLSQPQPPPPPPPPLMNKKNRKNKSR
ncbi:hypothetical protein Syun_015809 [Stephania yunnanensis]|uniref:Uncharacterized protein n=1 Tax=Stephania yunnanensis TaxID=152371 RepID=A0AAP0PAX1_9MAGN